MKRILPIALTVLLLAACSPSPDAGTAPDPGAPESSYTDETTPPEPQPEPNSTEIPKGTEMPEGPAGEGPSCLGYPDEAMGLGDEKVVAPSTWVKLGSWQPYLKARFKYGGFDSPTGNAGCGLVRLQANDPSATGGGGVGFVLERKVGGVHLDGYSVDLLYLTMASDESHEVSIANIEVLDEYDGVYSALDPAVGVANIPDTDKPQFSGPAQVQQLSEGGNRFAFVPGQEQWGYFYFAVRLDDLMAVKMDVTVDGTTETIVMSNED